MFTFAPNYALRSLVTATSRATAVLTRSEARSTQIRSPRAALSTYACRCSIPNNLKPRLLVIVVRGAASKASFEAQLTDNGHELVDIKRAYLKLARDFHPDANPNDPSASDNFVLLGKTYEGLQKRIAEGRGRSRDDDDLEDWEDEEDDEYGEAQARTTFSVAGGPVLTRQMRRELKAVSDDHAAGGARDGGWFSFAQMYGNDDGVQDLPGGPNLVQEQMALPSGRKPRKQRKK